MVLEMIWRERLILVIGDQESQNQSKEDYQACTYQMVLVIARHEAGLCGGG